MVTVLSLVEVVQEVIVFKLVDDVEVEVEVVRVVKVDER